MSYDASLDKVLWSVETAATNAYGDYFVVSIKTYGDRGEPKIDVTRMKRGRYSGTMGRLVLDDYEALAPLLAKAADELRRHTSQTSGRVECPSCGYAYAIRKGACVTCAKCGYVTPPPAPSQPASQPPAAVDTKQDEEDEEKPAEEKPRKRRNGALSGLRRKG